jgi:hypothetical protein
MENIAKSGGESKESTGGTRKLTAVTVVTVAAAVTTPMKKIVFPSSIYLLDD